MIQPRAKTMSVVAGLLLLVFGGVMLRLAGAQEPVEVIILRDRDSLTLYISGNQPVSLRGMGFEVVFDDMRSRHVLRDFGAFSTLYFDKVPAPICFRLVRFGSQAPLPQVCQGVTVLTQQLSDADMFWYDLVSNQSLTVLLMSGSVNAGICPAGQVECRLSFPQPEITTPTETPITTTSTPPTDTSILMEAALSRAQDFSGGNEDWEPFVWEFDGVEMVLVPTGCFLMGSARGYEDEVPVHEVCLNAFWIDRFEVTNASYGSSGYFDGPNRPREEVTWFDARDFCERRGARLPTEAEWEYAARGPQSWVYPWGDSFDGANATYEGNSRGKTTDVGIRMGGASWVGALDMSGNVWEWVSTLDKPYPYDATDGREGDTESNSVRIMRGGSWYDSSTNVRSAFRGGGVPISNNNSLGFRCVRSVDGDTLEIIHVPPTHAGNDACIIQARRAINVRAGPGTDYPIQDTLLEGTSVRVVGQDTGKDGNLWWQREYGGWIRWDLVDSTGDCDSVPVVEP
jgi:sulfatase modifying factor 1